MLKVIAEDLSTWNTLKPLCHGIASWWRNPSRTAVHQL